MVNSRHALFLFGVLAIVCVRSVNSSDSTTPASSSFVSAVSIVGETSIDSYAAADAFSQPVHSPVPDGFPGSSCTTCAPGATTEYCDFESGVCVKITNDSVGIFATNTTLLSSHSLARNPLYFHKLDRSTFLILYDDFSYQFLYENVDGTSELGDLKSAPHNPISVVVVEAGDGNGYLAELVNDDGYVITYDLRSGNPDFSGFDGYYDICLDSYDLQPAFSRGLFFLHCRKNSGRTHFLCSVDNHWCMELDLCNDPFPSPSGDNGHASFATVCEDTLTVYNMSNQSSHTFTNVSSTSYLSRSTLIVNTGSKQLRVDVEATLNGNTSEAVVILLENATECSGLHKLLSTDLYATVCRESGDTSYSIRLANISNGQSLGQIANLSAEPLDIYAKIDRLPPPSPSPSPPPSPPSPSTPDDPDMTSTSPFISPTLVFSDHQITPTVSLQTEFTSKTVTSPSNPPRITRIGTEVVIAVVTLIFLAILGVIVIVLLFVFVCKAGKKSVCSQLTLKLRSKKYPIQVVEEGAVDLSISSRASTTTSSSSLTVTTEAVVESGSQNSVL